MLFYNDVLKNKTATRYKSLKQQLLTNPQELKIRKSQFENNKGWQTPKTTLDLKIDT